MSDNEIKTFQENSNRHGTMKEIINGSDIKHMQFSEFSEGHGSVYGTLSDGRKFRLHISEIVKMIDEFDFSVYDKDMGNVLDVTLQVNWKSTENLRNNKNFSFKKSHPEFIKDGNSPNKVNYIAREGSENETKFVGHRNGPYYSGQLVILHPEEVNNYYLGGQELMRRALYFKQLCGK